MHEEPPHAEVLQNLLHVFRVAPIFSVEVFICKMKPVDICDGRTQTQIINLPAMIRYSHIFLRCSFQGMEPQCLGVLRQVSNCYSPAYFLSPSFSSTVFVSEIRSVRVANSGRSDQKRANTSRIFSLVRRRRILSSNDKFCSFLF